MTGIDNSISVLIPTHNRREMLVRTLESIRVQQLKSEFDVEVVVVANGCKDDTVETVLKMVDGFPFPLRCVEEHQLGLNSARNRAMAEAKHDVLAFLDDDVILSPGYLAAMHECYRDQPADIVGGRTELLWEAVQRPDWLPDKLLNLLSCKDHGDQTRELFQRTDAIGANFSFRKSVFDRIGPFRLGLDRTGSLLLGGGETDFLDRALKAGCRMFYAPDCNLQHWVAPNRPTLKYLGDVAHGTAMSYVFARSRFGPVWIFKATGYHLFQAIRHGVMGLVASVRGDSRESALRHVNRRRQLGYLAGIWLRIMGRSTLVEKTG